MIEGIKKYFVESVVGGCAVVYGVYRLFKYFAGGVCRCTTKLDGRVVVITGGTSGIGKALAIELAKRGADIVLAYRDLEKALQAKVEIEKEAKNTVYIEYLDLSEITSIVEFSETLNNRFTDIYALVNNAGVFHYPQGLTENGFEITLQTNYLGHFILTHFLLELLTNSDQARIINVSSEAHRNVKVDQLFALTLSQEEVRDHFVAYGVSKLALVLFTKELSKKLSNTNVIVTAVNPGNVETSIFRTFPPLSNPWLFALQWPIRSVVVKSPRQGSQTLLHTLLAPDTTTGGYYSDCRLVEPNPIATDDMIAESYYQLTRKILSKWVNQDL